MRPGRCDLWIAGENQEEFIEAKFRWLNMASQRMCEFAEVTLNSALQDAAATRTDESHRALGVAFLPLFFKATKLNDEPIETLLVEAVEKLREVDSDVFAYTFPERVRETVGEKWGNRLAGIVMLVKRAG